MTHPDPSDWRPDPKVEAEVECLVDMPIVQLRLRYRGLFRTDPPKAFGPDLFRRSIAHQIQVKAYGGLPRQVQRQLDHLIKAYLAKPTGKLILPPRIKPGSILVRNWKNKTHQVTVMADGFAYEGISYSSLSEIAGLITGTRWNGPRFFGLRAKPDEPRDLPDRKPQLTGGSGYRKRAAMLKAEGNWREVGSMAASSVKSIRCAIYTRKSTEHGLDLEFNSLDAQRDACEAYVKSQASQGWLALPQRYDDPAYSGGNLDRPALQQLLKDVGAGKVDVIVVYKIDRLTRSLADFAKLVIAFDAKSISFVAVTQQFNTTSSMGRLTLNVLLSFAQFERELSSERVRDKIAASRRKGKWTGGSVPLGYRALNKKLVIDKAEAETVRIIFKRYLELKSFAKLVTDSDARGIVTKRRQTKDAKYNGGIPFTYGPLAHFLKNRVYVGETRYKDKWFPGEHQPIVDRTTFDAVQEQLKSNASSRKAYRTAGDAILMGKFYDDRGNRMSPTYSVKNGIRYRFYVSSALLRGRKTDVGSVGRVAGQEIETIVLGGLREWLSNQSGNYISDQDVLAYTKRVTLYSDRIVITALASNGHDEAAIEHTIRIPWSPSPANSACNTLEGGGAPLYVPDQALLQSIVRSHAWLQSLQDGSFESVEALAEANQLHPKVVRLALRLSYLSPQATGAILSGSPAIKINGLGAVPKSLALSWSKQRAAWD